MLNEDGMVYDDGVTTRLDENHYIMTTTTGGAANVLGKLEDDATGLAHYLEHMLFKGTDKFGSLDYKQEKVLLDKIEALYEEYRAIEMTDTINRDLIWQQIDSISGEAAKLCIANEYDKMLSGIGAKGTNAYTSNEKTVYINDIPSNQIPYLYCPLYSAICFKCASATFGAQCFDL